MSQQVLWEVVKNNNAFLVKNNGLRLSRDPFNQTGIQTQGSTGFIQKGAFGLQASQTKFRNNFEVSFTKKTKFQAKTRAARKSAQKEAHHSINIRSLPVKHGVHTVAKIIKKRFGNKRQALQQLALKKLLRLNRATAVRSQNLAAAEKAQKK